uniref:Protein 8 n=1 Tax=Heliothis armigera cypovirus 14 TaxID=327947 RepID=Q4U5R8_9REOV|nr:protein 8 [Heliothis armigera cypovirus 14]
MSISRSEITDIGGRLLYTVYYTTLDNYKLIKNAFTSNGLVHKAVNSKALTNDRILIENFTKKNINIIYIEQGSILASNITTLALTYKMLIVIQSPKEKTIAGAIKWRNAVGSRINDPVHMALSDYIALIKAEREKAVQSSTVEPVSVVPVAKLMQEPVHVDVTQAEVLIQNEEVKVDHSVNEESAPSDSVTEVKQQNVCSTCDKPIAEYACMRDDNDCSCDATDDALNKSFDTIDSDGATLDLPALSMRRVYDSVCIGCADAPLEQLVLHIELSELMTRARLLLSKFMKVYLVPSDSDWNELRTITIDGITLQYRTTLKDSNSILCESELISKVFEMYRGSERLFQYKDQLCSMIGMHISGDPTIFICSNACGLMLAKM